MKVTTASLLTVFVQAAVAAESFNYKFNQRDVEVLRFREEPGASKESNFDKKLAKENQHHLLPGIHPELDTEDIRHLHTRQSHQLFYSKNGGIELKDADMVATLDALFHWEAVILDHTSSVKEVTCAPNQMVITLDTLKSWQTARANWTNDDQIIFVSSAASCHTKFPGQYGYFNASSVMFNQKALTATARGQQIDSTQAIKEYDIAWGEWEAAGRPSISRTASSASSTTSSVTSLSTMSNTKSTTSSSTRASSTSSSRVSSTSSGSSTRSGSSTSSRGSSTTSSTLSSSASRTSSGSASRTSSSASSSGISSSRTASNSASSSTSSGSRSSSITSSSRASSSASSTSSSESLEALIAPTGTGICGVPPSPLPSGFSQYFKKLDCDEKFDNNVDNFLTRLGDVSNLNYYLNLWAPRLGINTGNLGSLTNNAQRMARRGAVLEKRWSLLSAVVDVFEAIVDIVVAIVVAAIDFVRNLAESLLPTWNPSATFNVPVDLGPPSWMLDDSPWGDAFEIYKYEAGEGEVNYGLNLGSLAKFTGADELLTFEIDGVEQLPEPGVTIWCVDCGIKGNIKTTGSATFTFIGITRLTLKLDGQLQALLQLGVNGFHEFEKPIFEARILAIPIWGFAIPEIIEIGPYLTLDFEAGVKVEALGQMLAGIQLDWDKIGGTIDFTNPLKSKGYGFAPQISPVFNVSAELTATASIGLPIALNVGIDILDGLWEEAIALVNTPAIQAVAEYKASHVSGSESSSGTDECPAGIHFYSNLINELEVNFFDAYKYSLGKWEGPKFIEGCVGDNGVTTVRQQQQPPEAGKTRGGCILRDNVFADADFSNGYPGGVWHGIADVESDAVSFEAAHDDQTSSPPYSLSIHKQAKDTSGAFCWCFALFTCGCPEDPADYSMTVWQNVDVCTYSLYNVDMTSRLLRGDGICKITNFFVNGIDETRINMNLPVDQNILPVTPQNQGNFHLDKTIGVTAPAYDNKISYKFKVGFNILCQHTTQFDIRLDDINMTPDPSAFAKRALLEQEPYYITPSTTHLHMNRSHLYDEDMVIPFPGDHVRPVSKRQANTIPVIAAGGSTLPDPATPINAAPIISATTAAPEVGAVNAAPTIAAANNAPSFDFVPGNAVVSGTIGPGSAIPTADAVLLGPSDYNFPAFKDIMSLARGAPGNVPAPIASSGKPFTGWSQLPDVMAKVRLAASPDGNFYLVSNANPLAASPGTNFYSEESIAYKDEQFRFFHYFPDTMREYGVSRLRVAGVLDTPLTAQMVTLAPVKTPQGSVYVAADTNGGNFLLAWCNAQRVWQGSKVFLVKDYANGLEKLKSGDVQWIVTGQNVTECQPLLLTSGAGPLAG